MTDVAREYGEALFQLAVETDTAEAVSDGLALVGELVAAEPAYTALLASPAIPLTERLGALREAFEGRVPGAVLSFLCLLCENGRIGLFAECAEAFEQLYRERLRTVEATVLSATPLTDDQQRRLVQALQQKTGRRVNITCAVDPTLLGGVVVEMDGVRMDGSLKHRLQALKDVMNT